MTQKTYFSKVFIHLLVLIFLVGCDSTNSRNHQTENSTKTSATTNANIKTINPESVEKKTMTTNDEKLKDSEITAETPQTQYMAICYESVHGELGSGITAWVDTYSEAHEAAKKHDIANQGHKVTIITRDKP